MNDLHLVQLFELWISRFWETGLKLIFYQNIGCLVGTILICNVDRKEVVNDPSAYTVNNSNNT